MIRGLDGRINKWGLPLKNNPKIHLTHLTFLILGLNALLDDEVHEMVTLEEVKGAIREGRVFSWLRAKFPTAIDVSLYEANTDARDAITSEWQNLLDACEGNERRKWGIERNGICLLLAWTNELVQQRKWTDTD